MFKCKVLGLFVLVVLLVGCTPPTGSIRGSGELVTQEEHISGFDRLVVGNAFKVDIRQGETFSVVVRVDDNLLGKLAVEKRGSTLHIGLKPGLGLSLQDVTQEAEVTMPELAGLELSGAPRATVSGFKSTKCLDVDVSGASQLLGEIGAGDARFDVSGSSGVTLRGSAGNVIVYARGASTVDLADLPVADASVKAVGASNVTVNPSGILDANASGASHVYFVGNPRLGSWEASTASSIKRK
ncbi:MAG: head GIN domain-containing protein [Anaerolineae bacterium]|jgi:hypothetical protein